MCIYIQIPVAVEVIKEVPFTVERIVYKEVLVPTDSSQMAEAQRLYMIEVCAPACLPACLPASLPTHWYVCAVLHPFLSPLLFSRGFAEVCVYVRGWG